MMDDFGLYPREEPFDPLGVMLFKALQVIAFLFFLALLAVSPDAKDGKIDSKAEFMNSFQKGVSGTARLARPGTQARRRCQRARGDQRNS